MPTTTFSAAASAYPAWNTPTSSGSEVRQETANTGLPLFPALSRASMTKSLWLQPFSVSSVYGLTTLPTLTAENAPSGNPRTCTRFPGRSALERPKRNGISGRSLCAFTMAMSAAASESTLPSAR